MAHDDRLPPGFRPGPPDPDRPQDAREVRRRVVLEAPVDTVWRALTDPDHLAEWWGEGTTLDAVPGGLGRFCEEDGRTRVGVVVEVRPGRRLRIDWSDEDPDSDDPASRVTIELSPCPFGTVVTVVEAALVDLDLLPGLVTRPDTSAAFLPPTWNHHRPLAHAGV